MTRDDLNGASAVVLFYQEAATPDCHRQLQGFVNEQSTFENLGARIVAISADPLDRLAPYWERLGQAFPLLSDPGGDAASAFGVWDPAGRRARRAAFVLDSEGIVRHANPSYSAGRVDDILAIVEALEALARRET